MKRLFLVLLTVSILVCIFAFAAMEGSTVASSSAVESRPDGEVKYKNDIAIAAGKTEEKNPLQYYRPQPGLEGRRLLEEMDVNGVPVTAESVKFARDLLLRGSLSSDEKLPLLRILADLYNRENTTGANADIALTLKQMASDPDKQVAAQAAIKYARHVEYQQGTELVLRKALQGTDSYFQELAHLIPSSPPEKQREFLAEIRAAGSLIGRDVLVSALNSGEDFNAAPFLKSSDDMAELLRATEPTFGPTVGLGIVPAVRYAEWLRASATIESHKTGRSMDEIIMERLSQPNTDERKIMSFLISPQAGPLLAEAAPDSPIQKLVGIAQVYSAQSPGNLTMIEFVQAIRERMKHPPPPPPPLVVMPPTGPLVGPSPAPPGYPMYVPPPRR
jgi:hypothetical protein